MFDLNTGEINEVGIKPEAHIQYALLFRHSLKKSTKKS